jgi:hypothetical protein
MFYVVESVSAAWDSFEVEKDVDIYISFVMKPSRKAEILLEKMGRIE